MTTPVYKPSIDEFNNFIAATLVLTVAFVTFYGSMSINSFVFYTLASGSMLLSREIGQRIIAHWMEADTVLEISVEGSLVTLFGAMMSFLTSLPVIMLFPVFNEHDIEGYEHWGKSIDAMWIKRRYWIVSTGILALFVCWSGFHVAGLEMAADATAFFLLFQLLPFDYSMIPTGPLDGSIIIRWSGFVWLIFFGLGLLTLTI